MSTQKVYKLANGSGPDALPPNVFNLAPAGLTPQVSNCGICPIYNIAINSRKDLAQPGLLSPTLITVSDSWKSSLMIGSLSTFSRSTENPTPVPHINIYIHSSKALGLSTGIYEQLYPATWHLSKAGPDVINARILGIICCECIASYNLLFNSIGIV